MSLPHVEDKVLNSLANAIRHNDPHAVSAILETNPQITSLPYGSKHPTILHFAVWLDSAKTGSAVSYGMLTF